MPVDSLTGRSEARSGERSSLQSQSDYDEDVSHEGS